MSDKVGDIFIEIEMETKKLVDANREVNQQLQQTQNSANKAGSSMNKLEKDAGNLGGGFNTLASAVKGYITVQAALKLIEIADDMTMLQARVTRLSGSMEEAKNTMASLSTIAANTGNSLGSTEKLWETLTASLKEAGATNGQVLMLTDTLQKIGVVGGSSAEEMSNALRQFGQSIAGGVVRAEEFNSVLENMPELARQMAAGLGLSIGQLRQRMLEGKLTAEDALNAIQKQASNVNSEFDKMPVTVDRAKNSLDVAFKNMINDLNQSIGLTQELAGLMQSVANNLNFYNKNVGDSSRMPKLISLQKEYNDELKDGQRWYESDTIFQQRRGEAASKLKQVEGEIAHIRAKAAKDMEESSKPITVKGAGAANPKQDDLIKKSQRRIEMSKLEGEARARLQAQYDAEDAGINKSDPRVKQLEDQYAETFRNTQALKENNSEGKKSASQSSAIAQKLADLKQQSELAAESTQELTREKAVLNAQQSLGKGATEDDIRLAGEYAAKTFDSAKAVRDLAQAQQGRKFATQEIAAAKVMPDAQTGAVQDPLAQINLQEQQKIAALAQYQTIDKKNVQIYEDAKTAIQQQASNARRKIAIDEANAQSQAIASIIGSVSQGFDGLANLAANAAGSSSGAYKAMFALSKGFAVAQSALNLQLAISQVMADPTALTPAQKFANYAAVAGAGASLLSTIGSISYGGGREKGGPVSAGSMYQVGEGGMPEIYQASTGKQYMIPGDNGKVVSNADMMGGSESGGGVVMNVAFNIQTTNGIDEATQKQMAQMMQTVALNVAKEQSTRPGGFLQRRK